ncbi:MAG: hypothetical protein GC181_08770 [Bacteroidetes bacterium]|nr:hypothetical protein [Bacteroidota bacterium]
MGDPFFGDAISTVSRCAWQIYDSGFSDIRYPMGQDPGHPTTFPFLYALIWRVFGTGLPQSHSINILLSFGIVWQLVRWMRLSGRDESAWLAAFLMLCVPQFISHTAQMNTHLPLTFFVLSLAISLQWGKKYEPAIWSVLLLITHLQGLYYLVPVWLWWFWINKKTIAEKVRYTLLNSLLPVLTFALWLFWHHHKTGWWISSPDYASHRGMPSPGGIIYNLFLAVWRISDYGQIALFIIPAFLILKKRKEISRKDPIILFLIVFAFNALALAVTTQTGPAHRYVFPALPFLVLANVYGLRQIRLPYRIGLFAILLSGHFWFYPGKVLGDATLTYRNVFPLLTEVKSEFDSVQIYSYAPLGNPEKFTVLETEKNIFNLMYDTSMTEVAYVMASNIGGDFSDEEKNILNTWPVRTFEKGNVYLQVFANPEFGDIKNPNPRKPGNFEKFILELKNKLKH